MAATQFPSLTDSAWTDLGTTPCYVKLDDTRDVLIQVAASAPSNASKIGTRLSYTPPHEPDFDIGFDGQKLYARADGPTGGSVTVQRAG